jgi:predicted MFS family arabinose efflux permease
MGMSIGLSFMVAFSIGPGLTTHLGLSGLFWLTSILGILAMLLLLIVPTAHIQHKQVDHHYKEKFKTVLSNANLNRLHISIFFLHLIMTALFVYIPGQLVQWAGIHINQHGLVYLPLLLLGVACAVPGIIVAEKKRQMKRIFSVAVAIALAGLLVLAGFYDSRWGLIGGLGLFFIAFNMIEALLPSWVAKITSSSVKATAMGINASSQFLGAFLGGTLGGQLLAYHHVAIGWLILAGLAALWLMVSLNMDSPRYLTTLTVKLPESELLTRWSQQLLTIHGVEEVVMLKEQGIAYLKVDQQVLSEDARQELSLLTV